jgi:ABC-type multidrug transport system permease subunit
MSIISLVSGIIGILSIFLCGMEYQSSRSKWWILLAVVLSLSPIFSVLMYALGV